MKYTTEKYKLERATSGSAGFDLYSMDTVVLTPGCKPRKVNTGVRVQIPEGYVGLVFIRSSVGTKRQVTLANNVGVIDSDYRGPIIVALTNSGKENTVIQAGERVAQLVVVPFMKDAEDVDQLDKTERGDGGFGFTGTN